MIPCHISVSTAEKIFFIGESIQLFERDRDLEDRGGVLKDKEAEFYNQLSELSDSLEFRVADFERFVDTVRETASRHLHTLVLVNADLRTELDILRSFYFILFSIKLPGQTYSGTKKDYFEYIIANKKQDQSADVQ